MQDFSQMIAEIRVPADSVAIIWLGQAGFVLKSTGGTTIYVDPYLSNAVERTSGFKRIMPSPILPEDVAADLVISTHGHHDHLDIDAIPIVAQDARTSFAGPPTCTRFYREVGLETNRFLEISDGTDVVFRDVRLRGVFADHGTLAPDAIGVVLDFEGLRVYHTGDTALVPEKMQEITGLKPDVILPCINGAYGNMGPEDAARLVQLAGARLAIPMHFWMFAEHGGDPGRFLAACTELAPGAQPTLLTVGERLIYTRA